MKTNWDYTELAEAYLKRPDYSENAINEMLHFFDVSPGSRICDVGAGVAHLSLMLANREMEVAAVEPNAAMRAIGIRRTSGLKNISYSEGTAENTGQLADTFDCVTFGSSFNVTNRPKAMQETVRILKPRGYFAVMWNHRDLNDPIQKEIEAIITQFIPEYGYGSRRDDQTKIIEDSSLFGEIHQFTGEILHRMTLKDCVEAWRSHATLERQANNKFKDIILEIEKMLTSDTEGLIPIPYQTKVWAAQSLISEK